MQLLNMDSRDYAQLQPRSEYQESIKYILGINLFFVIISTILWISIGLALSTLIFSVIALATFFQAISVFREIDKSINVFPSSFETNTRGSHEIIPFEDIITMKMQFEIGQTGWNVFHPIYIIYSAIMSLQGESYPSTKLGYEIETEGHIIYDMISSPTSEDINDFISKLFEFSRIEPVVKDYDTINGNGSLYYFSFKDRHSDLEPSEVRDLI